MSIPLSSPPDILRGFLFYGAIESAGTAIASGTIGGSILAGALFGAVRYMSYVPFALYGNRHFKTEESQHSSIVKILFKATAVFQSIGWTWACFAAASSPLTLGHTLYLSIGGSLWAAFIQQIGKKSALLYSRMKVEQDHIYDQK